MESMIREIAEKHYIDSPWDVDVANAEEKENRAHITDTYLSLLGCDNSDLEAAVSEMLAETQKTAYMSGMRAGARLMLELTANGRWVKNL